MRIESVRELRDDACRFVSEWEREPEVRELIREPVRILRRLRFDSGECVTGGLGFNHADGLRVDVEEIVCEADARNRQFL